MELVVSNKLDPNSLAATIYEGIKFDTRYGNNKKAFIVPQSTFEMDNPELFSQSKVTGKYILSIQFEDKSVLPLNLYAENPKNVGKLAKEYVNDLMHVVGLDRAVWKVENENTLHFETKHTSSKNKLVQLFSNVKRQLDDFFWYDGEDR